MLYFLAVRMNVQRALMMPEIEFVDAGPSTKSELMEIKERYGFTATMEWGAGHACSYAGDFCAHIPAADEVTKKVDATDGSEVGKTTAMESLAVKGVSKDVAVVAAAVTSDNENRCAAASARELKLQKKLQKQAARRARKGLLPDGSTPVAAGAEDNNEEVA